MHPTEPKGDDLVNLDGHREPRRAPKSSRYRRNPWTETTACLVLGADHGPQLGLHLRHAV